MDADVPTRGLAVENAKLSPRVLGQLLDCQDGTFELLKLLEDRLNCVSVASPQDASEPAIGGYHIENAYARQKRINILLDNLLTSLVV